MSSAADTGARPFDTDLTGRTALVTGAASGIGAAVARRLAAAGATGPGRRPRRGGRQGAGPRRRGHRARRLRPVRPRRGRRPAAPRSTSWSTTPASSTSRRSRSSTPERFALILRLMLEAPFRLARRLLPAHVRRAAGAGSSTSPACTASGPARTSRPTSGQARPRGAVEGDRAGGAPARASPATASAPATCAPRWSRADRRPGPPPRHRRGRGPRRRSCSPRIAVKRLVEPEEVADLVGVPLRARPRLDHRLVLRRSTAAGPPR